jgi:hypothetical protein
VMNANSGRSEMKTDCLFVARDRVAAGRAKGGLSARRGRPTSAERYKKKCRTECWHRRLGEGRESRGAVLLLWWGRKKRRGAGTEKRWLGGGKQ